ncbi:MAG: CHAP domain-containing protein [Bacteroidia bacterium]|nr:CHAP domain-containing protein [Bacteroidia bacterium]
MRKKILLSFSIIILIATIIYFFFLRERYPLHAIIHSFTVGDSIDSYNGIVVYNNGTLYGKSHGKHYNKDSSFYYGKKWQCVEYIKRYYHDHLQHTMPNGFGHAKDFFKKDLKQGQLNKERDLRQFSNEGDVPPQANDILVFDGEYGHVAIVTEVNNEEIEIIQQNIYMTPRERYKIVKKGNNYFVGERRKPLGWLRLPH